MLLSEVQSWLTALPVLGPLFSGNIAIIILRLLALVATFYGGTRLLRWMWNHSVGAGKPSVRALVKAGHFEAAGDLCAREGDLAGALSHFDKASAWLKAGHTARRMGRSADAGAYYEKARDLKLAVAAYEAAGQEEQVVRLAPYMEEPSLLLRAARHWAKRSDHGQAAEFFKRARRLDEAEKHFLQTGAGGRAQAIQMYLEALEELPPDQQRGNAAHTLAGQAARLFLAAGQKARAQEVCQRTGLAFEAIAPATAPTAPPPSAAKKAPKDDLSLDAPLLSADDFFKGTNPGGATAAPAPAASPAVAGNHGEVGLADTAAPFAPPTANLAEDGTAALGPAAAATKPVAEARMPGAPRQEQSPNRLKTAAARKQAGGQPPSAMVESYGFSRDVTDRYDIQGEIGAGGMGEVYKAEDKMLGRIVALKFLTANMADNPMALKFFMREARSVAALNHPAIVTIFDIGVLDQRPFICMEFVEGTDLGSRLEDQGPIEVGHAVNLVIQVALALDYAHQQKVVHRDIKPSNILQARGGQVKILDFGLAKVIQGGPKTSTIVAGTPAYMAPEQLAGRDVDGRADLFSLGVLLYEVLTNHLPFDGMLRTETIAPATSTAPWLPAALDPLISRAVALDVDRRFANCKEFATALGQVARSLQATG